MALPSFGSLKRTPEHQTTIKDQEYSKRIMLQTNETGNTKIVRYEDNNFFTKIHTTEKLQLSCSKTTVHKYQPKPAIDKIDNSLKSDYNHLPGIDNRENFAYQKTGQTSTDLSNWNNRKEMNITSPLQERALFNINNKIQPTDKPLALMTIGNPNTVRQETLYQNHSFQPNRGYKSLNTVPGPSIKHPLLNSSTSRIQYKILKGKKPYSDVLCYQIGDTFHYKLIWDLIKKDIESKINQPKLDTFNSTRNEYTFDNTKKSNQPTPGLAGKINEENAYYNYNNFTGEFHNMNRLNQEDSQNIKEISHLPQSELCQQNGFFNRLPTKTNLNTQNNNSNHNLNLDLNTTVFKNQPNNYQSNIEDFFSDQSSYMDDI